MITIDDVLAKTWKTQVIGTKEEIAERLQVTEAYINALEPTLILRAEQVRTAPIDDSSLELRKQLQLDTHSVEKASRAARTLRRELERRGVQAEE